MKPDEELAREIDSLAKWLHHVLSAAQNLSYEDGDTCPDCIEQVKANLPPIIERAQSAAEDAAIAAFPSKAEFQINYWLNQGHSPLDAVRMGLEDAVRRHTKGALAEAIERAVAAEREACAQTARRTPFRCHAADDVDFHSGCVQTQERIVTAIRARSQDPRSERAVAAAIDTAVQATTCYPCEAGVVVDGKGLHRYPDGEVRICWRHKLRAAIRARSQDQHSPVKP